MKTIKKLFSVVLMFALLCGVFQTASVSAAKSGKKVKLNKTVALLEVGKSMTLRLKNATKKVTWKSSNKADAQDGYANRK